MTLLMFGLILFSGTCSVTGQIFFKQAMSGCVGGGKPCRSLNLTAGVLAMTVGFFTWLALLQRFNLSYLYPFEGLENVILAFGAWLFLRENTDQRALVRNDLDLLRNDACIRHITPIRVSGRGYLESV